MSSDTDFCCEHTRPQLHTIYEIVDRTGVDPSRYVGCTKNFRARKAAHKLACNSGSKSYVYRYIRENGGFFPARWDMVPIREIMSDPNDKYAVTRAERAEIERAPAVLNSNSPPMTPSICHHGKRGNMCLECGGTGMCHEHGVTRNVCRDCMTPEELAKERERARLGMSKMRQSRKEAKTQQVDKDEEELESVGSTE